jgi:hypothetical protein
MSLLLTDETHEVHYLDTVGDGLPDSVEHVYRRTRRIPGTNREVVEETHRLAFGIGIDGKPAGIRERTIVLPKRA